MEKNFVKTQTPPRSASSQLDALLANRLGSNDSECGVSPPSKFIVGSSPTNKMFNNNNNNNANTTDEINMIERRNSIKSTKQIEYPVLNSPRLTNTNLRFEDLKMNYDSNKSNMRALKNSQDQSNTIFIDDLEEETILDVIILLFNIRFLYFSSVNF
jgi:hypothetical protein